MNNNGQMDGLNVGLQNVSILNNTDIGLMRRKGSKDKSTYTRKIKADGTVIEKVKMNQKSSNKGLASVNTDGINFGQNAVNVGLSKEVSEDVVGFVDSIWGSKQVASKTQDRRLEEFKAERSNQLSMDSAQRSKTNDMTTMLEQPNLANQQQQNISRGAM